MSYDPKLYVVRVATGFVTAPFEEYEDLKLETREVKTVEQVLAEVQDVDISLVHDASEWEVEWMAGKDLTAKKLEQITL